MLQSNDLSSSYPVRNTNFVYPISYLHIATDLLKSLQIIIETFHLDSVRPESLDSLNQIQEYKPSDPEVRLDFIECNHYGNHHGDHFQCLHFDSANNFDWVKVRTLLIDFLLTTNCSFNGLYSLNIQLLYIEF